MTDCGVRFAGRRKESGGYTYYDFLQNRSFDIAGPNPTEEGRKRIDMAYVSFLDSERREAVAAELAKSRVEKLAGGFRKYAWSHWAPNYTDTQKLALFNCKVVGRSIEIRALHDKWLAVV
jgi:hypothetical protein